MEMNLANFAEALGQDSSPFEQAAIARKDAINTLLWNASAGTSWYGSYWHLPVL